MNGREKKALEKQDQRLVAYVLALVPEQTVRFIDICRAVRCGDNLQRRRHLSYVLRTGMRNLPGIRKLLIRIRTGHQTYLRVESATEEKIRQEREQNRHPQLPVAPVSAPIPSVKVPRLQKHTWTEWLRERGVEILLRHGSPQKPVILAEPVRRELQRQLDAPVEVKAASEIRLVYMMGALYTPLRHLGWLQGRQTPGGPGSGSKHFFTTPEFWTTAPLLVVNETIGAVLRQAKTESSRPYKKKRTSR